MYIPKFIPLTALFLFMMTSCSQPADDPQVFNEMEYTPQQTTFCLNAPSDAQRVDVRIYETALAEQPIRTVSLKCVGEDRWRATVEGDLKGLFYTFDTGHGECPGTFAKAVGVNGRRAAIIDLSSTDPEGWAEDVRPALETPADMVVYEMHHRDFSIHPSRGSKYPGKFLALTEPENIQ